AIYSIFFTPTATTHIYPLSLHDALPISSLAQRQGTRWSRSTASPASSARRRFPGPLGSLRVRSCRGRGRRSRTRSRTGSHRLGRSEEHTSELQSRGHLVCRLLLEKKKKK